MLGHQQHYSYEIVLHGGCGPCHVEVFLGFLVLGLHMAYEKAY